MRENDGSLGRSPVVPATASRRALLTGAAKLAGAGGLTLAVAGPSALRGARAAAAQTPTSIPDPQMQAVLNALMELGPLPLETLVPRQARELPSFADAVRLVAQRQGVPAAESVGRIAHRIIPGGPGSEGTLVRIYAPAGSGPFPVIVYFHGGGWVIANLNVYDASARALANAAGAVVVSVAYRQAPENPYPAAVEDAFAAYQWAKGNAGTIGGDPARVAVAGESAGGNLATVTALLARERGAPQPTHQLLVYPVADLLGAADYRSAQQYAGAMPLSTPALLWFGRYYLPDPAAAAQPTASPIRAPSLAGLAPANAIRRSRAGVRHARSRMTVFDYPARSAAPVPVAGHDGSPLSRATGLLRYSGGSPGRLLLHLGSLSLRIAPVIGTERLCPICAFA